MTPATIPPALALLRPPALAALAADARQPVTAANAAEAAAVLARYERTPERVAAWAVARAETAANA